MGSRPSRVDLRSFGRGDPGAACPIHLSARERHRRVGHAENRDPPKPRRSTPPPATPPALNDTHSISAERNLITSGVNGDLEGSPVYSQQMEMLPITGLASSPLLHLGIYLLHEKWLDNNSI